MTPEGKIKKLVKQTIESYFPVSYRFMPVQNGMGIPGLDFFYCIHGRFVAIETKAPGNKPAARQLQTFAQIKRAGGLAYVVDSQETLNAVMDDLVMIPCQSL
jgi:hypothetical protein